LYQFPIYQNGIYPYSLLEAKAPPVNEAKKRDSPRAQSPARGSFDGIFGFSCKFIQGGI